MDRKGWVDGRDGKKAPPLVSFFERRNFERDLRALIGVTQVTREEIRKKAGGVSRIADEYVLGEGECHGYLDTDEDFPNHMTLEESHAFVALRTGYVLALRKALIRHFTVYSLTGVIRDPDLDDGSWTAGD